MYGIKPELFTIFHLKIKEDKLTHLYGNLPLLLYDLIDLDNFIIKKLCTEPSYVMRLVLF